MLLKLMMKKANFLLLDEPTNHLDIKSREMLEDALADYEGTIFAISHDRYFINKLANRIMHMEKGKVSDYLGDYDYYLEKHGQQTTQTVSVKSKSTSDSKEDYLRQKKQDAELRKKRNRLAQVEKEIEETEKAIEQIQSELSLPETATDYMKCADLSAKQEEADRILLKLYEEWEELQSEL